MTEISLKVETNRSCLNVPMSIELDFEQYLKSKEFSSFNPKNVQMIDCGNGKNVPCQVSTHKEKKEDTISWFLSCDLQKEYKIIAASSRKPKTYEEFLEARIWDRGDSQLEIFLKGLHVASYIYNVAYERPFVYPLIGPSGFPVVRNIPTLADHQHHKGISLALGDVSEERGRPGIDFWRVGTIGNPDLGRVVHRRFTNLERGPIFASMQEKNIWRKNSKNEDPSTFIKTVSRQDNIMLDETRTITFYNLAPIRMIDIHTVLRSAVDEVILNADVEDKQTAKENGPLAIRVTDSMRETDGGNIVNSEGGETEKRCWGKQARWVDYYGPVLYGGPINGIAAFDHPNNPRHPTGWHVRSYGLLAPNPFYDRKPEWPNQGPIYLSKKKGDKLEFLYRVYVHIGDEKDGKVNQKWMDWVYPPEVSIQ